MSLLLIILSIIGAIPEIIDAVKMLLEWIREIRDGKTRRAMKTKLRDLVFANMNAEKSKIADDGKCLSDLDALKNEVLVILEKESIKRKNLIAGAP